MDIVTLGSATRLDPAKSKSIFIRAAFGQKGMIRYR